MSSEGEVGWLYVAACLAIPALWGLCCAWIFGKLDARRKSDSLPAAKSNSPGTGR